MKYFTSILINLFITTIIGFVVLLITSLLIRDIDNFSFPIYLSVFGFANAFIGGFIHIIFYIPFLLIRKQVFEINTQSEYLSTLFPILTVLFGFCCLIFLLAFSPNFSNDEMQGVLVGIIAIFIAQSVGAITLANRLKTNNDESNTTISE